MFGNAIVDAVAPQSLLPVAIKFPSEKLKSVCTKGFHVAKLFTGVSSNAESVAAKFVVV